MRCVYYILWMLWLFLQVTLDWRYFLIYAGTILAVASGLLITVRMFRRRKQRLSYLIWCERKKIFGYQFSDRLASVARDVYNPSLGSLAVILILILVVWCSAFWFGRTFAPSSEELQLITRLQNLGAGIALMFVPFTIFAVGLSSRRTESAVSAAEVLLRETYIFPITVLMLGLLATFALIKSAAWAETLIFITLGFAIFSVYRLCQVLLDEQRLYTSATMLLQDKIRRTIGMAIDERIGKNLLLKLLDGKSIEYSPFIRPTSRKTFFEILATHNGVVRDIYLNRLFDFAKELETAANSYGFSFDEKQTTEDLEKQLGHELMPVRAKGLTVDRRRYMMKLFGDQLSERSDHLISFPRTLVPDIQKRERLAKLARSAFLIKPGDTYGQRVERYLGLIKDEAIAAIRVRKTAYLASLLAVFADLATTFAEEMKKAIGGHSFQAALSERQTLFGGWNEMRWISRHLAEIHYRGCRSEDIYVAKMVSAAPLGIAYNSIRYRDSLVFDQFTSFALSLYSAVDEVTNPKIKQVLSDTCWMYLKDIGDVGIAIELEQPENNPGDLERIGSLGTILLVRYVELLKCSFDKRSFENFQQFKQGMDGLLQQVTSARLDSWHISSDPVETSRTQLEEDRAQLKQEETRKSATLSVLRKIDRQRQQGLFAIGSYVFGVANASEDLQVRNCVTQIDGNFPTNPFQLAELYMSLAEPEAEQLWSRTFYEATPEFMWARSKGTEYFCYLLLKFTYEFGDERFAEMNLPIDLKFISELREDGSIVALFRSIQDDREKWSRMIPDVWLPAIPKLHEVFVRATAEHNKSEEEKIIRAPIDEEYLRAFGARFTKEFEKTAVLRRVFKDFSAYENESLLPLSPQKTPKWGLSLLDMKRAYTVDGHKAYFNWPEEYARNLARSESETTFHRMLQQLPEFDLSAIQGLEAKLTALTSELDARGLRPNVILVAQQSRLGLISDSLKNFTPYWLLQPAPTQISGFLGNMHIQDRRVPVFSIWTSRDSNLGCALDLPSCMLWKQQSPSDNSEEAKNVHGFFYMRIVDFSTEAEPRKTIVESNPEWLRTQADKERYLSLRVWLQIFERFEVKVSKGELGLKFDLSESIHETNTMNSSN